MKVDSIPVLQNGILNRAIRKTPIQKVTFMKNSEKGERVSHAIVWERVFQAEGTASGKALRQTHSWKY